MTSAFPSQINKNDSGTCNKIEPVMDHCGRNWVLIKWQSDQLRVGLANVDFKLLTKD